MATEDMLADIWAHKFHENPKLLDEVEDEDFDPDEVASLIGYSDRDLPTDLEDL